MRCGHICSESKTRRAYRSLKACFTSNRGGSQGGYIITGEVLRVEGENYFVKGHDGKE